MNELENVVKAFKGIKTEKRKLKNKLQSNIL